jgi:hypothetical protein
VRTPGAPQKAVKNEGRSGNVYENKGKDDSFPDMESDFSAQFGGKNRIMTIWKTNREGSEHSISKMKVHPAIFMKIKKRRKVSGARRQDQR